MRTLTCLLPKNVYFAAIGLAIVLTGTGAPLCAQEGDVIPARQQNSGSFFNRQLGTALRFNYHTQGYGTQDDVVSLGGMKIFNQEGATWFLDGQGTLSNDFGGGFNLGGGYRQLTNSTSPLMSFDPQRILGFGFWTDGQSTSSDNFFTQLGFNLESLGDTVDMRLFASFPLERTKTSDPVLSSVGRPIFAGNNLFNATETVTTDTAHSVLDGEIAKRISDLEAWAYVGGYQLGGGAVNATGYRAGVRGYALPDLALSLQVTDDDVYATNVLFGITWFVGRTNRCNGPCGTILDRFREPVLRNNFIATTSVQQTRAAGAAATDPDTGVAKVFQFADSSAAGGGDGTFENPFNNLTDATNGHMENDTILGVSGSVFTDTLTLMNNADFLGEGNNIPHLFQTTNFGIVTLPETSPGAGAGVAPILNLAAGQTGITAGDNSQINNFTINGGDIAVLADGTASPTLSNLDINNPTGDGVVLRNVTGTAIVENTVTIDGAVGRALFVDGGVDGMALAATITNSMDRSLEIANRTGGTVNYTGTINDDGGTGIRIANNTDTTVNLTSTATVDADGMPIDNGIDINTASGNAIEFTGNTNSIANFSGTVGVTATGAANNGINITGNDVNSAVTFTNLDATAAGGNAVNVTGGGTMTFNSDTTTDVTRTIANTGTGNAFTNVGDPVADNNASIVVNSNIENSGGGRSVDVQNRTANDIALNGTVMDTGNGLLVENNTAGVIGFNDLVTSQVTGVSNAVTLLNNTGATIGFTGVNLASAQGTGFSATGGGTLAVITPTDAANSNTITTEDGIGLELVGMTIDAGGALFDVVNVTQGDNEGVILRNLDGTGLVTVGGGIDPGDGGTLSTAGDAVVVDNANNVTVTNVTIANNLGAARGVVVTNQAAGSAATFTGLNVNTADGNAVTIGTPGNSNEDGVIAFTNLTATTSGTGNGVNMDNDDTSIANISVNDMIVNATGTGMGFTATGGGNLTVAGTNTIDSEGNVAFQANNTRNLTASNVTIDNTTGKGVRVTGLDEAADTATLNNFTVTTTTVDGVLVDGNTNGTINLNMLNATSTDGRPVVVNGNPGATVNINDMEATATGAGDAFTATNGGVLNMTGINNVTAETGRGVILDGAAGIEIGAANATFNNVTVNNGAARGIVIQDTTGAGQVIVNGGTLTTAANAVRVMDGQSVSLNNLQITNGLTAGGGIFARNSAGDTLALQNITIDTDTEKGVDVQGGTFTANGANTITTMTGTGLDLRNATIGAGGVSFNSVNVDGATRGVVLDALEGSQVTVGSNATASTLNTTGDAIVVTNVANADINNVDVTSTGGRGLVVTNDDANNLDLSVDDLTVANTGTIALEANHAGAGNFTFSTTNSDLDDNVLINANGAGDVNFNFNDNMVTTIGAEMAFELLLNNNVTNAVVNVHRNALVADNASAFDFNMNSAAVKNVTFTLSNNTATNNSASASAAIDAFGPTILGATINDNTFTNTGAGDNLDLGANSGTTIANLSMDRNTTNGGTDNVVLRELNGADFNIVDRNNVITRNPGVGNFIFDSAGNVITDFDDIPVLP